MPTLSVFYIILLVCASLLCLALIFYLYKITKSIKQIEFDIKDLSNQLKPLITSTTNLSEKLNRISEEAKEQVYVVKNIISDVKDHVDDILELEEKVRRGVEEPVLGFIKNLSAVTNGINAFWNAYKHK